MNKTINISVLGTSGTGKTSCIVSMLDHLKKDFFDNTELQFSMPTQTSGLIVDAKSKLVSSLDKGAIADGSGIKTTSEISKYQISVGKKGAALPLPYDIDFNDFPGHWLDKKRIAELELVKENLSHSQVLIVAVDAANLMESDDEEERTEILHDILKNAYSDLNEARLVIFTLIKSEKYYKTSDSALDPPYHALIEKFNEKYHRILSLLTCKSIKRNVSVIVAPIQTLGSCKFMYYSKGENNGKIPVFAVTQRGVYAPKNTDQPLLYLLSFILKAQYEAEHAGFGGIFKRMMGSHRYLSNTSEELSGLCITNEGIKIVQNSSITNF